MPNKIIVEIEALDYTISRRDVEEALKSHFPHMPTVVSEIRPVMLVSNLVAVKTDMQTAMRRLNTLIEATQPQSEG